jgi:glycogen synthase
MLGWELPPHYIGGMGVACYSLCEQLAKSGANIEFILPFEADYSHIKFMSVNPKRINSIESSKITYADLYNAHSTAYGKFDISESHAKNIGLIPSEQINCIYMQKVLKTLVLGEYDIIHAHDWLTFRAAIMAKRITNLPLIVHIHATEFDRAGADENSWGNEMIHQIEYEGMMMADKIITVSKMTKNSIVKRYGIQPDKIDVVHNSIDLDSPYIQKLFGPTNDYVYLKKMQHQGYKIVINVGRQSIQKGLPNLLDAAKLALDKNPKIIFVLVGSGDMYFELIEKSASLGISSNVIFTGFMKGNNLRSIFSLADLFVMPSVSEPFGSTPLEAIGLGTPILISNQSGVGEVIRNALKVDFWDINLMADMILKVVENDSLASSLWQNAFIEYQSLSWQKSAGKVNDHYRTVVSNHNG